MSFKTATTAKDKLVRQTKYYSLYQGCNQTADLYTIIRRYVHGIQAMGYSSWFPEMQKKQMMELSDENFDIACSKIDFS